MGRWPRRRATEGDCAKSDIEERAAFECRNPKAKRSESIPHRELQWINPHNTGVMEIRGGISEGGVEYNGEPMGGFRVRVARAIGGELGDPDISVSANDVGGERSRGITRSW